MDSATIIQELTPLFADILDQPELKLTSETDASSVEGWDSLVHINLLVAIERQYKIRFALGEWEEVKNLGDISTLIIKKING